MLNSKSVTNLWLWLGPCLMTVEYAIYLQFCGSCFPVMGHMALSTGNIDMGTMLKQVVKIFNLFSRGSHGVWSC